MNNISNNTLTTVELEYSPGLSQVFFAPISDLPWAMLLHSASTQHPDSRFDILTANPLVTLETKGNTTFINQSNTSVTSTEDPFYLLNHYLQQCLPPVDANDDIPFQGGALGYFGYDLGRRIEPMPQLAQRDFDIADMAIGIFDWALIVDHHKQCAFVVGINPEKQYQWLQEQADKQNKKHNLANRVDNSEESCLDNNRTQPFSLTSDWQPNMTKAEYAEKFNAIQHYLRAGDCYQINLTQRFSAGYQGDEWSAYLQLAEMNQAPFSAFIRTQESAILSISPERLLQLKHKQIETKPIKGTRPRSSDPVTDQQNAMELKQAEKDQAENLMIVDLLRNDIGRVASPGSVKVPKLFEIESFPAVHHLVSTVTATLDDDYDACDLLRACFPGGSITGAPKVRAMQIIEELEPHIRSAYCGSIGYISRCGTMDTSITIRTLIAHKHQLYAWAGGGIVADSQCDDEYQETLDKLSKILPVLSR